MFSRLVGGSIFCLVLCAFAIEAGGTKESDKKISPVTKAPAVTYVGTIKSVDLEKGTFIMAVDPKASNRPITDPTDKSHPEYKFEVDANTKFIGPKGGNRGKGKEGLKDDCMANGSIIRVTLAKITTKFLAEEIHLPTRKGNTTPELKTTAEKK